MPKPTTPTNDQSIQMTKRQQLNRRIELDRVSGKLLNRLAAYALGCQESHVVYDHKGKRKEEKMVDVEMTMGEIRAAEIVLRKCVPDLAAQILVTPENDNLSREELTNRIAELASNNPQLALVAGLDIVVDKAKTVKTIENDNLS